MPRASLLLSVGSFIFAGICFWFEEALIWGQWQTLHQFDWLVPVAQTKQDISLVIQWENNFSAAAAFLVVLGFGSLFYWMVNPPSQFQRIKERRAAALRERLENELRAETKARIRADDKNQQLTEAVRDSTHVGRVLATAVEEKETETTSE
jgi:hypothetical protein